MEGNNHALRVNRIHCSHSQPIPSHFVMSQISNLLGESQRLCCTNTVLAAKQRRKNIPLQALTKRQLQSEKNDLYFFQHLTFT
jgi:hypothetical protein